MPGEIYMKIYLLSLCTLVLILSCGTNNIENILVAQPNGLDQKNKLSIPPILKPSKTINNQLFFDLSVQRGTTEFIKGNGIITYGYNGHILGPTIRVKKGQHVNITVKNKLYEYTTVHWHGLLVAGEMDGGPHQVIPPDKEWTASFIINQPAATAWYHPHGLGTTAIQVYKGLAGLFIIDDELSEKLNLPDKYGTNDIPLIIQDKRFTTDGVPVYLTNMMDTMTGMTGNTILVNGVINPYLEVNASKYRFRLLNGSNARVYEFRLSDDSYFYQIATDAGLIERPVKLKSIVLSPAERAEIIIDFSKYGKGNKISLISDPFNIIDFNIRNKTPDTTVIPEKLVSIKNLNPSDSKRKRIFNLEGMGFNVSINGKQMDMDRIDEYVKYGDTETWILTSASGGMMGMGMRGGGMMGNVTHNFHAHGIHFLILDRNGSPPKAYEQGWKDTILLPQGEEVRVIAKFLFKGIFMYHCHILEHEDNGMMGQFKVE
jgi:blue copper oxidase